MLTCLLVGLVFFLASIVQGLTGFGGGMLALPLLCLFLDIRLAVGVCILAGLGTTTIMAWELRRFLSPRRYLPLLIGSLPGMYLGTVMLRSLDPHLMQRALGVLLIAISCFNLVFKPRPVNPGLGWGYLAGFLSGAINAALAAGGPPVIIYTALQDWKKEEIKATLTGFFLLSGCLVAVMHALNGMIGLVTVGYSAAALPCVIAGTVWGSRLTGKINRRRYLQLVYCLLMLFGVLMLMA